MVTVEAGIRFQMPKVKETNHDQTKNNWALSWLNDAFYKVDSGKPYHCCEYLFLAPTGEE